MLSQVVRKIYSDKLSFQSFVFSNTVSIIMTNQPSLSIAFINQNSVWVCLLCSSYLCAPIHSLGTDRQRSMDWIQKMISFHQLCSQHLSHSLALLHHLWTVTHLDQLVDLLQHLVQLFIEIKLLRSSQPGDSHWLSASTTYSFVKPLLNYWLILVFFHLLPNYWWAFQSHAAYTYIPQVYQSVLGYSYILWCFFF